MPLRPMGSIPPLSKPALAPQDERSRRSRSRYQIVLMADCHSALERVSGSYRPLAPLQSKESHSSEPGQMEAWHGLPMSARARIAPDISYLFERSNVASVSAGKQVRRKEILFD